MAAIQRGRRGSHSSHPSHSHSQPKTDPAVLPAAPVYIPVLAVVLLLGLLTTIHAVGIALFTKGFLLTRVSLDGLAACSQPPARTFIPPLPPKRADGQLDIPAWEHALQAHAECSLPPTHRRTILLVIDALRYDFLAPLDDNLTADPHYHNRLTLPAELATAAPDRSLLVHFLADAPTTTLQRLKGLTTGTLPTFVDAGANFGRATIDEDNWLVQLRNAQLSARNGSRNAGLAFMGDDTWTRVFDGVFDENMTWPYDSFNVEDLDTVDQGVQRHLFPFLNPSGAQDWSLLVGHMLGVDHVGHRFGPSHPQMATKLDEMDAMLRAVVQRMPHDALLLLMGDHGMDQRGDHGGDGELEVGAALWAYSKTPFAPSLTGKTESGPLADDEDVTALLTEEAAAGSEIPAHLAFSPMSASTLHRSVPQIDLVPTLSLLLGLPVPFNSLGTVIPELLSPAASGDPSRLLRALRINARQVRTYLRSYMQKSGDLAPFRAELDALYEDALRADARATELAHRRSAKSAAEEEREARRAAQAAYWRFTRATLVRCRSVWAQFEGVLMAFGASVLVGGLATAFVLFECARTGAVHSSITTGAQQGSIQSRTPAERRAEKARKAVPKPRTQTVEELARVTLPQAGVGAVFGAISGLGLWALHMPSLSGVGILDTLSFGAAIGAQVTLLIAQRSSLPNPSRWLSTSESSNTVSLTDTFGALLPLIHALLFASNSFTVWEDRAVLLLLGTALVLRLARGFGAPTARLRRRIPLAALLALGCARLATLSRLCREEQGRDCISTFYARGTGGALNSPYAILGAYIAAYFVPSALAYALSESKSYAGVAPLFLNWLIRPGLLAAAGYWAADRIAPSEAIGPSLRAFVEWIKLAVARVDLVALGIIGLVFLLYAPLCLELRKEEDPTPAPAPASASASAAPGAPASDEPVRTRVMVLGFANSLGSAYLLFLSLAFSLLFLVSQPMGQIALSLCMIATVALAELGDCERDSVIIAQRFEAPPNASTEGEGSSSDTTAQSGFAAAAAAASGPAGLPPSAGSARQPPPPLLPTLLETSTVALLGFVAFFNTGHQAVLSSIQWRLAFLGVRTVSYPLSPLLVAFNAFGPLLFLPAFASPLLVLWNLAPRPRGSGSTAGAGAMRMPSSLLRACLGLVLYHATITTSTVLFAALFKRHLMLFKIWTPRFMLGAVSLLGVDAACILATLATGNVASKIARVFGSQFV